MPTVSIGQAAKILYEITRDCKKKQWLQAVTLFAVWLKKHNLVSRAPEIVEAFIVYAAEQEHGPELRVSVAHALTPHVKKSFKEIFRVSREPVITSDPKILGGFVVRDGDVVYDASVTGQLACLREKL